MATFVRTWSGVGRTKRCAHSGRIANQYSVAEVAPAELAQSSLSSLRQVQAITTRALARQCHTRTAFAAMNKSTASPERGLLCSLEQTQGVGRKIKEQKNTVIETASSREEGKRIGGKRILNSLYGIRKPQAIAKRPVLAPITTNTATTWRRMKLVKCGPPRQRGNCSPAKTLRSGLPRPGSGEAVDLFVRPKM